MKGDVTLKHKIRRNHCESKMFNLFCDFKREEKAAFDFNEQHEQCHC